MNWSAAACGLWKRSAAPRRLPNCRIRAWSVPDVRPVLEAVGDCSVDHCVMDAEFLKDTGFVVVAPHTYFPRLRLELDKGLGWKAEVEAALERLLENATRSSRSAPGTTAARLRRLGTAERRPRLLDRQLVGQQLGESEGASGPVVLAQQVEPLDRGEDSFGDGVASLRRDQHRAVPGLVM